MAEKKYSDFYPAIILDEFEDMDDIDMHNFFNKIHLDLDALERDILNFRAEFNSEDRLQD